MQSQTKETLLCLKLHLTVVSSDLKSFILRATANVYKSASQPGLITTYIHIHCDEKEIVTNAMK